MLFRSWGITPGQGIGVDEAVPTLEQTEPDERPLAEEAYRYMDLQPGAPIAGLPVDVCFIGSCTNGRLSDLQAAAAVAKGRHVAAGIKAFVVPGSEQVAAGCGFFWGAEFEITWAGASREHSRIAPNMFLYWSLMEGCADRGARVFNFGRCSPGSSTHRFKSQWGTRDQVLPWSQWTSGDSSATPTPDSAKFRAAVAVWSRLPLPVANAIGPILSRSIP